MLALDALEGDAPTVLLVLTTRTPFPTMPARCECDDVAPAVCERCSLSRAQMAPFYDGLRLVKRALRRRWPAVEYASLLEFTTGYAERSGGLRRPHWNLIIKGIPAQSCAYCVAPEWHPEAIAAAVWCEHVDAEPQAQHATSIYHGEGLMKYLALHFNKQSQEPPDGFTGQRFNCSRGYFTGCTRAQARARAADSLAVKRELWKQLRRTDDDRPQTVHDVELTVQLAHRLSCATRWVLVSETGARLGDGAMPLDHTAASAVRSSRPAGWGDGGGGPVTFPVRELLHRSQMSRAARRRRQTAHDSAATWREIPWSVLFTDAPG